MSQIILVPIDLTGNEIQNVLVQGLGTDPGSPTDRQVWFNTASNELKIRIAGVTRVLRHAGVAITDTDIAAANKDGAAATPSMRTLGTGAAQSLPGNTRLDTIASPTTAVSLASQKITGLANGTADGDAANVGQLNSIVAGLDYKASVRAATAAAGTLATSFANSSTIDGVVLATGDRILIKNQAAPAENGIYLVNASGAPTRATDMDSWTEIPGAIVAVELGTANSDSVYLATADQGGTLGTTAVTFSKLGPSAGGGGVVKFSADITGNASATQFTVTHSLNTTDVGVHVYDVTADLEVITDNKRPTANTVRIDFAVAPANAKVYRVVVLG